MFASVTTDCIECGACAAICPQVFRMNSYEIAEAYTNPVPSDDEEATIVRFEFVEERRQLDVLGLSEGWMSGRAETDMPSWRPAW